MSDTQEQDGRRPPAPPPQPLYRSAAGEQAIQDLYTRALAALPYEHEVQLVPTTHGTAHVVVCGPAQAPPLVLWHGMGAPAPFMLRLIDPLVPHFRTYCPDLPLHAGSRSEPAEFDAATHEHGQWCLEVLQGLGLVNRGVTSASGSQPPFHVGVSFGAAVLLDLAAVAPQAIRGAALFVPAGLMPGNARAILLHIILPSMLYRLIPCRWTAWLALKGMCDEPEGDLEMVLLQWRHVVRYPQLPGAPSGFSPDQLRCYSAPTLVITAQHDLFWPGEAAAAAAQRMLPHCHALVLPGARHLPAAAHMVDVNRWLLEFFQEGKVPATAVAGPQAVPA